MDLTLVVMAAGLGSRFGGTKQLAEVGPGGEAFLDFAITDALAAGVTRVVLIVRTDIEADVRRHVGVRHASVDVAYICQDRHGPSRVKPWGTGHAVLSAASDVDRPFIVCNADDYYGAASYRALASAATEIGLDEAALVGFRLGLTLPSTGSVSRGICAVHDGRLVSVVEHHGISRTATGSIVATEPAAELSDEAVTSMNLWAFTQPFFDRLARDFDHFLAVSGEDDSAEFVLPTAVSDMMADGELTVSVVPTAEAWVGVTHPADLEVARDQVASARKR